MGTKLLTSSELKVLTGKQVKTRQARKRKVSVDHVAEYLCDVHDEEIRDEEKILSSRRNFNPIENLFDKVA